MFERVQDKYRKDGVFVSTVKVDGGYETAIKHPEFKEYWVIIIDTYDSREEAIAGHEKWLRELTRPTLSDSIRAEIRDAAGA